MRQNDILMQKIGFDTAEPGLSKAWVTSISCPNENSPKAGMPVYSYKYTGVTVQAPRVPVYPELRPWINVRAGRSKVVFKVLFGRTRRKPTDKNLGC